MPTNPRCLATVLLILTTRLGLDMTMCEKLSLVLLLINQDPILLNSFEATFDLFTKTPSLIFVRKDRDYQSRASSSLAHKY